ncbi:MAG TPA: deoxyguanosinetriphosphate triphosphohydrolase [Frankiaceae bacterium]|nr:deoxyguanosinetriphosphate triphosphohydrolase [Frankiaceae bacterium]
MSDQDEHGYSPHDRARWAGEPRKLNEAPRGTFERDRARVLHSSALRRLAGKTQVVGVGVDDFPRTRLTHTLEVAQVGREIGAALGADPDLVDAAGLAHDLGHPPFGHNGEKALDRVAQECGGFEGNAQSFRELVRLESKIAGAGLNLSRATLDAVSKYPWPRRPDSRKYGVYADDVEAFTWMRTGAPDGRRCLEAQVMDWADDVAYSVHDLEDGIHAGFVDLAVLDDPAEAQAVVDVGRELYGAGDLDAVERLRAAPWWVRGRASASQAGLVALKSMTSELTARFSLAATLATRERYGTGSLSRYDADLVVQADERAECAVLKAVTARWVMNRSGVASAQSRERELLVALVTAIRDAAPEPLEPILQAPWRDARDDGARLRVIIDQVARLTDASAVRWYERLVGRG